MRIASLSAALILFAAPALASDESSTTGAAQDTTGAASAEQPKEPKKICRRYAASESRLGAKKICLTADEWKRRDKEES